MMRTHYCGAPRKKDIGQPVTACGWVQNRRDMGGVIFIDLKDREGVLQIVCDAGILPDTDFHTAETVRNQSVVQVSGTLAARSEDTFNPRIATGEVELRATRLSLLSAAQPLPFSLDEDITSVREDLRLTYRYLDIRRPDIFKNLQFRHRVQKAAEDFLCEGGFLSVETPILTKSTPEGARDYLVPSRVHPGEFYALPQSPQIFKQLLMVGGIDRYYQVARCFRDEDLRADRQPEFTQVDMEMSFVEQEDVLVLLEKMFKHIYAGVMGEEIAYEFPRLTYAQAMDTYGSDKPDLRFELPIVDVTHLMRGCGFSVFRAACERGGVVRAINVEGAAHFTRTEIEGLTQFAIQSGAKGMAWIAVRQDASVNSILTKYFTEAEFAALLFEMRAKPGDFILFCADKLPVVRRTLGALRLFIGERLGLRDKRKFQFLFITDFPQFEYSSDEKRYVAMHHPFTMPHLEDMPYLTSHPARVRAQAYDVVLNGTELGSGSIRIHRSDIQRRMFEALGFSEPEIQERFGFMVNAFQYGTPPHGGFAFGLDRLVMLLLGADSLREVIAFPKLRDASCPMTDAPATVDRAQLEALGMRPGHPALSAFHQDVQQDITAAPDTSKKQGIDAAYVAKLARIRLSDEEMRKMPAQMQAIVGFAATLSAINTQGITMADDGVADMQAVRQDRIGKTLPLDDVLRGAKDISGGYFAVPRML